MLAGFNDLATLLPDIAAEWSDRNYPLLPTQVTVFANRKAWWKCKDCGREWNTLISTRSGGSKCPYCSGYIFLKGFNDLQTTHPEIASDWSEKNLPLKPDEVNASRSCEDIDEATLSYAEIKAVATGNPLIKEKMEIDNDVQRLKLLKASYDNQRYGLQDNFRIKYPKLIKTATEKLANVREDVKERDKELIASPDFAITIGKATYTERVDGGTMMLEAISKCKTGETTAIGKFHGLELLVEKNFLGINYMVLRGKTEYKAELSTSPVGSMVKLENLFNGLHENIDFLEKKIEQYQNDLEASKTEYDKPFAYSEELEEKLARQCELNAQLDLENAKAVDADLSGPEEEREADDRMESAAIVAEDKGAYSADREGRMR